MLAMAEYAYNNSKHSATKISPFYANYGFEPRSNWPMKILFRNPASELYGHYMESVFSRVTEGLQVSIEAMRKHYDKKRKTVEPFKVGELVMLNGRNIRAKHRCKKLEDKMFGPFKVLMVGSNQRYCRLELPSSWKIHPVFNISLLERYRGDNPERPVVEIEADEEGWKMENIIASGPSDDDPKKHVYLVKWEGFMHDENTWETYDNVVENSKELLDEYYGKYPLMEKDGRYVSTPKKADKKKKKERRK
jgi:hypothetical protein